MGSGSGHLVNTEQAVEELDGRGYLIMNAIARYEIGFFDMDGLLEGSGSWEEFIVEIVSINPEALHKLERQGILESSEKESERWWSLTALGAKVAQELRNRNYDSIN